MYKATKISGALCLGLFVLAAAARDEIKSGNASDLGETPAPVQYDDSRLDKTMAGMRILSAKNESLAKNLSVSSSGGFEVSINSVVS